MRLHGLTYYYKTIILPFYFTEYVNVISTYFYSHASATFVIIMLSLIVKRKSSEFRKNQQ